MYSVEMKNIDTNKNEIVLQSREGKVSSYSLELEINNNNNKNIENFASIKCLELLAELNTDIIDRAKTIYLNDNESITIWKLRHFGKNLGIKQKYQYFKTSVSCNNNVRFFKMSFIDKIDDEKLIDSFSDCEQFKCNCNMEIIMNKQKLIINYSVTPFINDNNIQYIENLIVLLLKKILYRLKIFIENF